MEKIDICYILIGLLGVAVIYLIFPKEKISVVSPNIEETIRDSLIRDSIYIVNDSIVEKIRYVNKEYDKRYLISFLILTVSICSFSQNTSNVIITSEQLRVTNLIFAEHKKFSETIPLLNEEIVNLKLINRSLERTDSIRKLQLTYYGDVIKIKINP